MDDEADLKGILQRDLQMSREALLWKVEGLSERATRTPRTPTGMNLLGIVKHAANVEIGYFGDVFGRTWTGRRVTDPEFEADPQADWYATEHETAADIIDQYRAVWTFADETIASHRLDAIGQVPWWPAGRREVSLGRVMTHVLTDLARHAGHADIVRESIDGAAGLRQDSSNLPDEDWVAYVAKLDRIAARF